MFHASRLRNRGGKRWIFFPDFSSIRSLFPDLSTTSVLDLSGETNFIASSATAEATVKSKARKVEVFIKCGVKYFGSASSWLRGIDRIQPARRPSTLTLTRAGRFRLPKTSSPLHLSLDASTAQSKAFTPSLRIASHHRREDVAVMKN